jgi:hypothetical protein
MTKKNIKKIFEGKKKSTVAIIISAAAVTLIIVAYVIYCLSTNTAFFSFSKPTKESADSLITEGIKASKNKDTSKALTMFTQAKEQYEAIGDKNGEIDAEAQIFILEHK